VTRLAGRRILIVGASSGIGYATAKLLSEEGAHLAVASRRLDRLEDLAAESPGDVVAVSLDVRDPGACETAVSRAARELGGLDALIYCTGIATLASLVDAEAEAWREAFEINVMGASLVTRAAIPHLRASAGRAFYLSSIAADERPARRGLALYSTTKLALNHLIECWQEEERGVAFTRISVGDTGSTEMASGWDAEAAGDYIREWVAKGNLFGRIMTPDDVANHIADLLVAREAVPTSTIVPRFAQP